MEQFLTRQDIEDERVDFTTIYEDATGKTYIFNIWGMLSDSKDAVKFGCAKGINFGRHYFWFFDYFGV